MSLILGLNKYTHTTASCLMGADGRVLFATARERLTRVKGEGGDVTACVTAALEAVGAELSDISIIVQNSHIFAIAPFERQLPYAVAEETQPADALAIENLGADDVTRHELSHHLAHAHSVLAARPFDDGLIVVMDGIGNRMVDVVGPEARARDDLTTDVDLPRAPGYTEVPDEPAPFADYREAETVYVVAGGELSLLFKRWTRQRSPTELHNAGFENHESLGALYSRASSHVFGTWNACGKVMGLAAYGTPAEPPLFQGPLAELAIDWNRLVDWPHPNAFGEPDTRSAHETLAATVQRDLEAVVLPFLIQLRERTGARNLAFTGGVALNSLLNGRIAREGGFDTLYIPPYPGDDGIAVGCAHYGARALAKRAAHDDEETSRELVSPFWGRAFDSLAIDRALAEIAPWVSSQRAIDRDARLGEVADRLAGEQIVAWFEGESEFGPRALGHRSILAHPGPADMRDRINRTVKRREPFRPFAPTVLAERAGDFFVDGDRWPSPYMSLTLPAVDARRDEIASAVHVDGTGRLQTLRRKDCPNYYDLIAAFEQRTGLPLVLNTSFNIGPEPIVDSPADALRALLNSSLDLLVLEDYLVERLPFPQGLALEAAQPARVPGVMVHSVANAAGEVVSVQFADGPRTHDLDEVAMMIWDFIPDVPTVADLLALLDDACALDTEAATTAIEALFKRQLITLAPAVSQTKQSEPRT